MSISFSYMHINNISLKRHPITQYDTFIQIMQTAYDAFEWWKNKMVFKILYFDLLSFNILNGCQSIISIQYVNSYVVFFRQLEAEIKPIVRLASPVSNGAFKLSPLCETNTATFCICVSHILTRNGFISLAIAFYILTNA